MADFPNLEPAYRTTELIAFGLNHNNTPLDVLEKAVIVESRLSDALADFSAEVGPGKSGTSVEEAVILSTCNRCEIYAVANKQGSENVAAVAEWLHAYCGVSGDQVRAHSFTRRDGEAVHHLMRVASSLDSMIIGEPQILGQVKAAYRAALDAKTFGPVLSRLFENAISIAKKVRSETELGKHPVSYASAAIRACRRLFENLADKRVLLIGTGEMIESAARHCRREGVSAVAVAGRSSERTRAVAAAFGAQALTLDDVGGALPAYDVVISCTASTAPVLARDSVAAALKARKHKPMCIIDMALPRDVEATVAVLPDAYLYTLEDLANIVGDSQRVRKAAAARAEDAVREKAREYAAWVDQRRVAELIAGLLAEADDVREQALEKAMKALRGGASPETVLTELAKTLTGKLVHPALETLKQAAGPGQPELLETIRQKLNAGGESRE